MDLIKDYGVKISKNIYKQYIEPYIIYIKQDIKVA